ncbi:hypothetical protein B0T22DRAFT_430734 [Podospora appendiculata]|uniref:Protein kinase domain-containing protein n=1 Tax=Podospora appendiculata TaxID=314037 RepID=A0AAE0X296_9PEZI|nr:hypothetical protein B0T22DRAFT_430734 [Podospora appendiculata]
MSVELALAVVGTAELCLQYGKKLVQFYKTVKGAHKDLEGKILQMESLWYKTNTQLRIMNRVSSALGEDQARVQDDLLERLAQSLSTALRKIESTFGKPSASASASASDIGTEQPPGPSKFNPLKYAFIKESLDRTLRELEQWHRCYDPTWFLITLISNNLIDQELSTMRRQQQQQQSSGVDTTLKPVSAVSQLRAILHGGQPRADLHIALDGAQFDMSKSLGIKFTNIRTFTRSAASSKGFIVDTIQCTQYTDIPAARSDAESLARTLKTVDPETFGLLRCQGLVKARNEKTNQLEAIHLLFRAPSGSPKSLREELLSTKPPSLTRRLDIAKSIANSVSFIHVCNLVHKNLRPESILSFLPDSNTNSPSPIPVFLLGFDGFRTVHYQTLQLGDAAFERNLYRHPTRQGPKAQAKYTMQHDIYSLGVCLLELGLWRSFITYNPPETETATGPQKATPSPHPDVAALGLDMPALDTLNWPEQTRFAIKERLVHMARAELPACMGERYTAATVACLTCLDPDSVDFMLGGARDEDGVLIGTCFIEKVIMGLGQISM